jgi:hypothetical protein
MFRRTCLHVLIGMAACAFASPAGPQSLTSEQIREAEFLDGLSIPNPGELFAALGKSGKPDWAAFFRRQPPASHITRPLIALNLGIRLADAFLAAEAQDRQQVKNVSLEIKLIAKGLGLEQDYMVRINSIADFADSRQWDALVEEIEAVRGELAATMEGQRDADLAMLMALGCWLRSVDIATAQLAANYTPEDTNILRGSAIGEYFSRRLIALPVKTRALPVIAEILQRLPELSKSLSFPDGNTPPKDKVFGMHRLTAAMISIISAPEK